MAKRALISVSDKTGIIEFSRALVALGYEIVSTGGTFQSLHAAGIPAINISEVTGYPECLDGRVKTLHPKIHGGILAVRENSEHMQTLAALDIQPIDLVAINLYPFKATIAKENVSLTEAIENIDIGGPTMIRAAAKNYQDVVVVVNPKDYDRVIHELKEAGTVSQETKFSLSCSVFEHTAAYDALIANYLREQSGQVGFPDTLTVTFEKAQEMRYGENPHQAAAFYKEPQKTQGLMINAEQLHGKELSFNNINDANAAIEMIKEFSEPCALAVKHANPCGVGIGDTILTAYRKAYEADKVSIFGGIVALNRPLEKETAEELNQIFIEIVIAPAYSEEALDILKQKKNIRILKLSNITQEIPQHILDMKKIPGGLLVQSYNSKGVDKASLKLVTKKKPSDAELESLIFAMKVVKHTKSNGIVLAKDQMTLGVGPGQTNRITALKIALDYAGDRAVGSVLASDAFFPFGDCVEEAHQAGIKAIIQPGGSVRDQESIDLCNRYGIAMVFTGLRHFKH